MNIYKAVIDITVGGNMQITITVENLIFLFGN